MTDNIHMARAIALSREKMREGLGGPFGAVIVKDNAVIAEGFNLVTSSHDPTAHAEVVAIRNAAEKLQTHDLSGLEIYSSCEPCPMCLAAIYWARLDRLYFANNRADAAAIGFDDAVIYEQISLPLQARTLPCIHTPSPAASAIFQEWQDKPDKTPY